MTARPSFPGKVVQVRDGEAGVVCPTKRRESVSAAGSLRRIRRMTTKHDRDQVRDENQGQSIPSRKSSPTSCTQPTQWQGMGKSISLRHIRTRGAGAASAANAGANADANASANASANTSASTSTGTSTSTSNHDDGIVTILDPRRVLSTSGIPSASPTMLLGSSPTVNDREKDAAGIDTESDAVTDASFPSVSPKLAVEVSDASLSTSVDYTPSLTHRWVRTSSFPELNDESPAASTPAAIPAAPHPPASGLVWVDNGGASAGASTSAGGGAEALLTIAHRSLRLIEWKHISRELLRTSGGSTETFALSRPLKRGESRIDLFISHSWYDDVDQKYDALCKLAAQFKRRHRRDPTFWLDKVCIDQDNISDGLKVLPINVMACRKMLVLAGRFQTCPHSRSN